MRPEPDAADLTAEVTSATGEADGGVSILHGSWTWPDRIRNAHHDETTANPRRARVPLDSYRLRALGQATRLRARR